jgi:hypothetical protein
MPRRGRGEIVRRRKGNLLWFHLHMVNTLYYLSYNRLNEFLADVEAEDVELGNNENDLAFDVDEGMVDEDPDALDSDNERADEDEELGIDIYETESKPKQILVIGSHVGCSNIYIQVLCISCLCTPFCPAINKCEYFKHLQLDTVS